MEKDLGYQSAFVAIKDSTCVASTQGTSAIFLMTLWLHSLLGFNLAESRGIRADRRSGTLRWLHRLCYRKKMMEWLTSYSSAAALTDKFKDRNDHRLLLAAGLLGETGSIVAEVKKMAREAEAYPAYRQRLTEELGDFLWYFVRLVAVCDPQLLNTLSSVRYPDKTHPAGIEALLDLGSAVGQVLHLVQEKQSPGLRAGLRLVWDDLVAIAGAVGIDLKEASDVNFAKTHNRWPAKKVFHGLFDEGCPVEEQIPRKITIEFLERRRGARIEVLLRCNGICVGDRLTDNIPDPDSYRYHDIFHFAHAVFLGWSPVVRSLLRCKRKSVPSADENQDGARAAIIEEAVSAIVFSRAKQMRFFEGAKGVDFDLLKSIQEFIRGYEVDQVPLWQWEVAILEGYRIFNLLRSSMGGQVTWDLNQRTFNWAPVEKPIGTKED